MPLFSTNSTRFFTTGSEWLPDSFDRQATVLVCPYFPFRPVLSFVVAILAYIISVECIANRSSRSITILARIISAFVREIYMLITQGQIWIYWEHSR